MSSRTTQRQSDMVSLATRPLRSGSGQRSYAPLHVRSSPTASNFPVAKIADCESSVTEVAEAVATAKGLGPRIYVGGVSTAISQTMIRNHFSQYGKVCRWL